MHTARKVRARLTAFVAAILTTLCIGIIAPAQSASAATYAPITGAGSTWSYPAIHAWINQMNQEGLPINYQPNGSSNGRTFFADGQSDWAASEIPYGVVDGVNTDSPPARGYAYMPDTAGGLAFTDDLSTGGQPVTGIRLSGAVIAVIITSLPPVASIAPSSAAPP